MTTLFVSNAGGEIVVVDPAEMVDRLFLGAVASCSCLTKSPDVLAHDRSCRYRLLMEAAWVIQRFMVAEVSS